MKALSSAERESLVAKVVSNGFFDRDEAVKLSDAELEKATNLKLGESACDPNTGSLDTDDLKKCIDLSKPLSANRASSVKTAEEPAPRFPASLEVKDVTLDGVVVPVPTDGAVLWPSGLKGRPFWAARKFADGSWAFALKGERSGRAGVSAEELRDSFEPCRDAKTFEALLHEADAAFLSRYPE